MLDQVLLAAVVLSAGVTGLAFGAAGLTVTFFAPLAFKRLDYRRADALVRRYAKGILKPIAVLAVAGAVLAAAGGAVAAAAMLAIAAGGLLLVRWVLNPLPKKVRMAGATRKMSKQRILALQILAVISLLFPAALVALAFGV